MVYQYKASTLVPKYLQYIIYQISLPDQYSAQFGSSGNATLKHKCLGFTEYYATITTANIYIF